MEQFKIIQGFENYSVSNLGNIINNKTNRILKHDIWNSYRIVKLNKKKHKIHRLVALAFIPNPNKKQFVDHIDNNPSNNNANNLRWVTAQENQFNKKKFKNNTSGFKGVSFDKRYNKWRVDISQNNKHIFIGNFYTIEDAIIARYKKAKEIQGEYINECEKTQYDIAILKKQKQLEIKELEELEKELEAILNK
jgi:hypothetical protein